MRPKPLLILLIGAASLSLLWMIGARLHSRQNTPLVQADVDQAVPSANPLVRTLQDLIKPASLPDAAQENARASEQFGEALKRAGIATQSDGSR